MPVHFTFYPYFKIQKTGKSPQTISCHVPHIKGSVSQKVLNKLGTTAKSHYGKQTVPGGVFSGAAEAALLVLTSYGKVALHAEDDEMNQFVHVRQATVFQPSGWYKQQG